MNLNLKLRAEEHGRGDRRLTRREVQLNLNLNLKLRAEEHGRGDKRLARREVLHVARYSSPFRMVRTR